jgi:dienelactone hydrolase
MEVVRRPDDLWIPLPSAVFVQREEACDCRDSRGTGRPGPARLPRRQQLLSQRAGDCHDLPQYSRLVGIRQNVSQTRQRFKREDSYKDLAALLDWIKAQPELDGERVMVAGGSYGGHATLAVATQYSDKIRCAVDFVGMSNLVTFLERTESYRRDLRRAEYGDERDPKMRAFMEGIAAMNNLDKLTKPLFVIQGKNDPRVPVSESEQIVAALKKRGTPVWYLMATDEGHGFAKKRNQDFQFYATVLFVKKYLLQ